MSNAGVPQKVERHTYFYVFADRDFQSIYKDQKETAEATPDCAVRMAFEHLKREYSNKIVNNATVNFDVPDSLCCALGIEFQPAFAFSDFEIPLDGSLRNKPPNLPSRWKLLKFRERKRILESGTYVPKVEREIISQYKTPDSLWHFVQDLHLKNIHHGMNDASRMVESEVLRVGGRKILKAFMLAKQTVYK